MNHPATGYGMLAVAGYVTYLCDVPPREKDILERVFPLLLKGTALLLRRR